MAHISKNPFLLLIAVLLFLASAAVYGAGDGKIPITTSSEKARDLFLKGRDLAEKLRFQEAREYFEKAVAEDPEFALAHMSLAYAQPSIKKFFESFNKAVALIEKASDGERLMILGNQAGINAEAAKQHEYLKKLVAAYPNDERAHNLLGNYLFGVQDYPAAIEHYKKAIEINAEFSQPYNQMGYSHRFLGDYEQAEIAFRHYVNLIPDDPNPYDSYAELLLKMGNYEKSIKLYQKALDFNPNFVASFIGIATNYNLMGQHQTAREEIHKLLETAKDDGQRRVAYFAEAVSYADEGKLEEAIGSVKKQYALAKKINDVSAMAADFVAIGNILLEMGEPDRALDNFKKAVQTVEDSDLAQEIKDNARRLFLYNASRVNAMKGEIAAAKDKAAKHLALTTALGNPFQIRLSHELAGIIALAEEDYDRAIEELMQANLLNPYNHWRLAQAYLGKSQAAEAKEACDKAAHFNALNNINYAFIRHKAEKMLESM